MKTSRSIGMEDSLEKAEVTLQEVLQTLEKIESHLAYVATGLSSSGIPSNTSFMPGSGDVVVCMTSGLTPGAPLADAIQKLRGRGMRLPPLVLTADVSEGDSTCRDIIRTLRAMKPLPRIVITIREVELPTLRPGQGQVVIGTRYVRADERLLQKIEQTAGLAQAEAVRDSGEFGGGALAYSIISEMTRESISFIEVTLSRNLVETPERLGVILSSLSGI